MDPESVIEENAELVNDKKANYKASDDIDCEYIKQYPESTEQQKLTEDVIRRYEENDGVSKIHLSFLG